MTYLIALDLLLIAATGTALWLERSAPRLKHLPMGTDLALHSAMKPPVQARAAPSPPSKRDPVTRLPARQAVIERFQILLNQARRHGTTFGVVLVGLDDFDHLSDQIGKDSGNRLLANLARRLVDVTREVETVGYMRGQDFAVLVPNPRGAKGLDGLVSKLRAAIETPFPLPGVEQSVAPKVRFGKALYRQDGDDWTSILTAADHRLLASQFGPEAADQLNEHQAPTEIREPLATLGLSWPITQEAVKSRYKELAKRNHPDANGGNRAAEERLKTINLAYAAIRSVFEQCSKQAFAS
jgi:diguanylate cyclase (GGDEF)-like protein